MDEFLSIDFLSIALDAEFSYFFCKNQPNQIFFWKSGSVNFKPLWCPNFMQKSWKKVTAIFQVMYVTT